MASLARNIGPDKSAQPAKAPRERTLSDVFDAVTQLRDEVNALWEKLAPIALYQPRDPEAHLPEACRRHECDYYRQYLAYGGPDLTHEGYHAAEKIAAAHFASCGSIRNDRGSCQVCISHEQRLRA
jgi:hypothetical protein